MGKKAGAPDGSSVVFELDAGPRRSFAVVVDGRAKVVDDTPADPTVRLTIPFETFVALCGGRRSAADAAPGHMEIEGDEELGRRILAELAFTP